MKNQLMALLGLCAAVSSSFAAPSAAQQPCTAQTTKGSWMYTCEGTLPAPTQTATRILGRCSAARSGYFSCDGTVNLGGQIIVQGLQGQATTLPNCTGTISYAQTLGGAPAGQLDINYVVSEGGDVINGLPTNTGGVLSCTLKRIDKGQD
jgi:hypothetical protein